MKKTLFIFFLSFVLILGIIVFVYKNNLAGIRPIFETPKEEITKILEDQVKTSSSPELAKVDFPLQVPDEFAISLFAKNVSGARVMAIDSHGNLWVSRTKEGIVTLLEIENGRVVGQADIFKNMKNPHGLAFDPKHPNILYIAEEDKISFVDIYTVGETSERASPSKIVDLPGAGRHFTRTLLFDNDGNLFVSIGSTCDVCQETDERISTVMKVVFEDEYRTKAHLEEYATGLRNSVFLALHPQTEKIWATEMGRDNLGDNIPPDEVNIIENGKNYGWPNCYGKNIHDDAFDKNIYIRNPCMEPFETASHIDLPAHSAALGLAFVPPNSQWPQEYWNNLLVAYHGSWNRTVPTGYKVVRYVLDANGQWSGDKPIEEDFIAGWLKGGKESYGRPVDLLVQKDGSLYISDDKAAIIYKVQYLERN